MNGMAVDSWPYVTAAYAVTWVVILGYSFRLFRMKRRIDASHLSSQEPS